MVRENSLLTLYWQSCFSPSPKGRVSSDSLTLKHDPAFDLKDWAEALESIRLPDHIRVSLLSLREESSSAPTLKLIVFQLVKLTEPTKDTRLPGELTYSPLPFGSFQHPEPNSHTKRKSAPQTSRDETWH